MKTIYKTTVLTVCVGLLFTVDVPPEFPLRVEFAPEAHAILGVRRRAFRRGAVIGASTAAATEATAAAATAQSQPAAVAPAPAAAPAPATATASPPAPAPATSGKSLPLGTVVSRLGHPRGNAGHTRQPAQTHPAVGGSMRLLIHLWWSW